MKRFKLSRAAQAAAAAAGAGLFVTVAIAFAADPPVGGSTASSGPVTRVAAGVTVVRPYGESSENDSAGFVGRPGFSTFAVPHGAAARITLGPDGALWFVDGDGFLVRFDTVSKRTKRFDTGGATGEIVTGTDGRIYAAVADSSGSQVTVLTPEGKKIRDVDVPLGVVWLQAAPSGVWFASQNVDVTETKGVVGLIRPNGTVRSLPSVAYPSNEPQPSNAVLAEAMARLGDGSVAAVDQRVVRLRGTDSVAADPLFVGLTEGEQFGRVSDAVGGAARELYVLRTGDRARNSTIWKSSDGVAEPFVVIPHDEIRAQYDPWPTEAKGYDRGDDFASVLRFGPDGKLWYQARVARNVGSPLNQSGFLGRVDEPTRLTEWRMPWPKGDVDSAIVTDGMTVGVDGRIWLTDVERSELVAFRVPDLQGWRSLKPQVVSAKRARDRAAVTIRCVGQPGKLCFGSVWLTRGGKRVGSKLTYAVEAHAEGARPEIVRYLKLPKGAKSRLGVRLSNGPRAALR